jgi:hypothetical protein
MYKPSSLYSAALAYALERVENKEEQINILSAKYGLLSLTDPINTYNETLIGKPNYQLDKWGEKVYRQIAEKHDIANTNFIFLAGRSYVNPLIPFLYQFEEPLEGMKLGERVSWLRRNVYSNDAYPKKQIQSPTNNTVPIRQGIIRNSSMPTICDDLPSWEVICQQFENTKDIRTVTQDGRYNIWISVETGHNELIVGPAKNNQPSSKMSPRAIGKSEFDELAPYYKQWREGKVSRVKIADISQKSSYIFAIIHDLLAQPKTEANAKKEEWTLVKACALRENQNLKTVPGDKPGWYRCWAPAEALQELLNSTHIEGDYFDELLPHLVRGEGNLVDYYCLYVGVAINESIRGRLNWHVNQKHSSSAVTSGFLSTLRQSIASLIAGDQYNEEETNRLIDQLYIEYITYDLQISSPEAKRLIEKKELDEMEKVLFPLNIKDNSHPAVGAFRNELRSIRSHSK